MVPWQEMLEIRTRDRKTGVENVYYFPFKNTIIYLKYKKTEFKLETKIISKLFTHYYKLEILQAASKQLWSGLYKISPLEVGFFQ